MEDVKRLQEMGAQFSKDGNRFVLPLENGGSVVGCHPTEGLHMFVYDIRGGEMPDLLSHGFRCTGDKGYIRSIACRSGECELNRNGKSVLLRVGEAVVDYGMGETPMTLLAQDYRGVETIVHTDKIPKNSPIFKELMRKGKEKNPDEQVLRKGSVIHFEITSQTKRVVEDLMRFCMADADPTIVLIKASELGYNYMNDYNAAQSYSRYFVTASQLQIAEDIHRALTEEYGTRWTAGMFSEKYHLSATSVKKYFKSVYGYDFKEYQIKVRMDAAKRLLRETGHSISEISSLVGYATHSKFSDTFRKHVGMTPIEYRRQAMVDKWQDNEDNNHA